MSELLTKGVHVSPPAAAATPKATGAVRFIDAMLDPWTTVDDASPVDELAPRPHALLTPTQWHAVRARWPEGLPTGLLVENDVDVESIEGDLRGITLVVLQFPKWVDGRAYTQARLLRVRLRYAGDIRATGAVLVDMVPLLQRTGFSDILLRSDQSRTAAERALTLIDAHYQADAVEPAPLYARQRAWASSRPPGRSTSPSTPPSSSS